MAILENTRKAIEEQFSTAWTTIPQLNQALISSEAIGTGGMAEVFKLYGKDGEIYALKSFSEQNIGYSVPIVQSLSQHREYFNQYPFVSLRAIPISGTWYVTDYFRGKDVQLELMHNWQNIREDRKFMRRIMLVYAFMMKSLHSAGYVFGDNNWGAVLFSKKSPSQQSCGAFIMNPGIFTPRNGESKAAAELRGMNPFLRNQEEIKICDYDSVSPIENTKLATAIFQGIYRSQQHTLRQPITPASELESFALMMDHLIIGRPLLQVPPIRILLEAQDNRRAYPEDRAERLPQNLRGVLPPKIQYPRNDSITIDNIIEAIQLDFAA